MKSFKNLPRQKLLIVALAGFGISIALVVYLSFKGPVQDAHTQLGTDITTTHKQVEIKPAKISYGFPIRLKIPEIGVNAVLDYVVLSPNGELGAPKGPANAGWYVRGPRPGENGSAVIDGHFGWKDNIPAVFDNLHKLQIGDSLYVEDERGVTTTFVVRALQTYGQTEDDSAVFRSNDGKAHLNLITCEGTWSAAQKSYSNRLVVFADIKTE